MCIFPSQSPPSLKIHKLFPVMQSVYLPVRHCSVRIHRKLFFFLLLTPPSCTIYTLFFLILLSKQRISLLSGDYTKRRSPLCYPSIVLLFGKMIWLEAVCVPALKRLKCVNTLYYKYGCLWRFCTAPLTAGRKLA